LEDVENNFYGMIDDTMGGLSMVHGQNQNTFFEPIYIISAMVINYDGDTPYFREEYNNPNLYLIFDPSEHDYDDSTINLMFGNNIVERIPVMSFRVKNYGNDDDNNMERLDRVLNRIHRLDNNRLIIQYRPQINIKRIILSFFSENDLILFLSMYFIKNIMDYDDIYAGAMITKYNNLLQR
jgi:hypothetical protein